MTIIKWINLTYIDIKGKPGKVSLLIMIINVIKRRRECGTYLATARRDRRRLKMMKKDE